jgi:uncharacterized membrane protein
MKATDFTDQLGHEEIAEAIRSAEKRTSGELRVFISRKEIEDPVAAGEAQFVELGMNNTRERNGVLLFIAPRSRKFAVIGDTAIHARCGDEFWQRLTTEMSAYFQKGEFTQGIVHGVQVAGELLGTHFPLRSDDRNELPDKVEGD